MNVTAFSLCLSLAWSHPTNVFTRHWRTLWMKYDIAAAAEKVTKIKKGTQKNLVIRIHIYNIVSYLYTLNKWLLYLMKHVKLLEQSFLVLLLFSPRLSFLCAFFALIRFIFPIFLVFSSIFERTVIAKATPIEKKAFHFKCKIEIAVSRKKSVIMMVFFLSNRCFSNFIS